MYDYEITRISWAAVFRVFFAAGTCLGGLGGLALGLMEPHTVGLMGGAFLGLMVGLISGLVATAYAGVFNLLAPYFGGIPVNVTAKPPVESPPEGVSAPPPPPTGADG